MLAACSNACWSTFHRGDAVIRDCLPGLSLLALLTLFPVAGLAADWGAVEIANQRIEPGELRRFSYHGERSFEGAFVDFPVFVARGATPGPTLCVTSGIHGDEVNSVEIARRVFDAVEPRELAGTLVVLPSVNTLGFRTRQRNMMDRRDLNRAFPGSPNGSVASIVAHTVFEGVVLGCSYLIDLHTGSNLRTNQPQVRVDGDNARALELAHWFAVGTIITSVGPDGSIRREATRRGIPTIIYEAGPPYIFLESEIERGVEGVRNVMSRLAMIDAPPSKSVSKILVRSRWLRVPRGVGGIYMPRVQVGDSVAEGQLLATIADPISGKVHEVHADIGGVVIGMALARIIREG
jgi:predicted deacylase